ncbi:histidine phosphatase family protein [Mycolicibacter sinensis]|uniref:Phosphoglycerate mutase n=1 Tax=Mycolicibacter sinensis (strain JDM601) TaxID=875328 RepID=A0A1A3TLA8_MYCSD|nr:histidine phosphatase family protein [Mycolicibacter sinensis]OBK83394.1 hypothetical protein A5648_00435 [Mycolicibacter sinensis]
MPHLATRSLITAGVVLAGATGIAAAPAVAPPLEVLAADIQLTAGEAKDIVLEFVRHGTSTDNVQLINGTVAPGAHLTSGPNYPLAYNGELQAEAVGDKLYGIYGPNGTDPGIDGIFASGLVRTQETAAPFAGLMGMNVTNLSGLNEINAGIWEGIQSSSGDAFKNVALSYLAAPMLWTYGLYSVPLLGSSDYNGMAFQDRFSEAVQQIYDTSMNAEDPTDKDVAFSHGGSIMVWVMMNVKNPDPSLILEHPLSNTSQVVLEGNPTDGWTLVSWDGIDVAPADTATQLFVAFRDLMTVPQMAMFHIEKALLSLDPDQITSAFSTGATDVWNEMVQFPQTVWNILTDTVDPTPAAGVATDLAGSVGDLAAAI